MEEKEGISIIWYTVFQNNTPMLHRRRETLKKVFFTVCFETTLNMWFLHYLFRELDLIIRIQRKIHNDSALKLFSREIVFLLYISLIDLIEKIKSTKYMCQFIYCIKDKTTNRSSFSDDFNTKIFRSIPDLSENYIYWNYTMYKFYFCIDSWCEF